MWGLCNAYFLTKVMVEDSGTFDEIQNVLGKSISSGLHEARCYLSL